MRFRLGLPPSSSCQLQAKNNIVFKQKGKGKLNVVRNGTEVSSNHRCCAERRLLQSFIDEAKRHGIPSHAQTAWVRRKYGGHIIVWRTRADGTPACATPCLWCTRELQRHDFTVHCSQDNAWFSGRMCSATAPKAKLTTGQRRHLHLVPKVPPSKKQQLPPKQQQL